MMSRSCSLNRLLFLAASLVSVVAASPFSQLKSPIAPRALADIVEWTAIGDSYASGVGAGVADQNRRCFRFNHAYPRAMQGSERMPGKVDGRTLNNVVCSGATCQDVLDWQFLDKPTWQVQYGDRPAFGKPQIATLTVGGDDIDFIGLVNNCVYEFWTTMSCQKQIDHSWTLLRSPDLANNIDKVIKKTVEKGRAGVGDGFKVYVTGYPTFFNLDTDQCSEVTWSIWSGWPGRQGKMTKELRQHFNDMSNALNGAVIEAVDRNKDNGVVFVDWNDELRHHRYCEEGVIEPDPKNDKGWFFQWNGEDTPSGAFLDEFARTMDPSVPDFGALQAKHEAGGDEVHTTINPSIKSSRDVWNVMFDIAERNPDNAEIQTTLTNRVRVFHPKTVLHSAIANKIFDHFTITSAGFENGPCPFGCECLSGGAIRCT